MALPTCAVSPSYADAIKANIAREVEGLIAEVRARVNVWADEGWRICRGSPAPVRVMLGYTIAMHRGVDLYRSGDTICGLSVVIDPSAMRSIIVETDEVDVERERLNEDDVDPYRDNERETRQVRRRARW